MRLMNLSQLDGGVQLKQDVSTLQESTKQFSNAFVNAEQNQAGDALILTRSNKTAVEISIGSGGVTNLECTQDGIVVYFSDGTTQVVPIIVPSDDTSFITPAEIDVMFLSEDSSSEEPSNGDILTERQALNYLEDDA